MASSCSSLLFDFFPPSAAQLGSAVLESPQVVLLCAGAFRQADVVHGHLAAPASPTLPLQDDLVNSRKGCVLPNAYQSSIASLNIFFWCGTEYERGCTTVTQAKIISHHV